jgi:hypothetical protein
MAQAELFEPVSSFFYAWFGFTLAVFPLVATVDSTAFGGRLGGPTVLVASVVVSVPAALEFLFSKRNPRLVAWFVGVFVVLYFLAIVVQAGVYVALGLAETVAVVEFLVLGATYVVAYALVYKGGLSRLRSAVGR